MYLPIFRMARSPKNFRIEPRRVLLPPYGLLFITRNTYLMVKFIFGYLPLLDRTATITTHATTYDVKRIVDTFAVDLKDTRLERVRETGGKRRKKNRRQTRVRVGGETRYRKSSDSNRCRGRKSRPCAMRICRCGVIPMLH